jgi:hypothetical protein
MKSAVEGVSRAMAGQVNIDTLIEGIKKVYTEILTVVNS